jgi:alpha-D-ribose 1-methylphosphonate 5-triphosphate synthase subunit PhnG
MTALPDRDDSEPAATRRRWLAVLAHAPRALLQQHAGAISGAHFERLRAPETALAMVRARIGNGGDRFNLGDATITRCVVRHRGVAGAASAGVGYVLGRDEQRAEWIARLDALLQQPEHRDALLRDVIAPLEAATRTERARQAAQTATSRVDFFTLAPESSA